MPPNRPFKPFGVMIGPNGVPIGTIAYGSYDNPIVEPPDPVDPIDPPPVLAPPTSLTVTWRSGFAGGSIPENTAPGTVLADLSSNVSAAFTEVTDLDNKFSVVDSTLVLFAAFNYEAKTSHIVTLRATNPDGSFDRTVTMAVLDVDEIAPTITSAASFSVPENAALNWNLTANEAVTWSIAGGADAAFFSIVGASQARLSARDFEAPADANADNVYLATFRATDAAGNFTDQPVSVTVTNAAEGVPANTVLPSFTTLNLIVGQSINVGSGLDRGTWTNTPTSWSDLFKVNGATKTLPYTFLVGDVGQTATFTTTGINGSGSGTQASPAAVSTPIQAAAPAGTIYLTDPAFNATTPRYDGSGASKIRYKGKSWDWDADYNSWQISSLDNDYVRFETRAGDVMDSPHPFPDTAGTERNRLVEQNADWHTTQDFIWKGSFIIDGGFTTGSFKTFLESHTFGTGGTSPGAKQLEVGITTGSKLFVTSNYSPTSGSSVERYMWTASTNFVQGHEYFYEIYFKRDPTGNGRLHFELDGVVVVNFYGQTGHHVMSNYATEFGTYRGGSPSDTAIIRHKITELTFGAFGTLPDPDPPGETLGSELAGARQPFTNSIGVFGTNATAVYNSGTGGLDVTNTIISAGNTFVSIDITSGIVAGKQYKAVMTAKNVTSNLFYFGVDCGTFYDESTQSAATTNTALTLYFTAPTGATTAAFYFHNSSTTASRYFNFVSFSLKEVLP